GVNLNIQANETITLLHNKIADNPLLDIEAEQKRLRVFVFGVWGFAPNSMVLRFCWSVKPGPRAVLPVGQVGLRMRPKQKLVYA
ncbi:MAG: hypothetical protein LBL20_07105, partial [Treponema sp.]|nr:hypothetical protein [Treponema sp.]